VLGIVVLTVGAPALVVVAILGNTTAGLLVAGSARAQPKYPSEPVKLVVPRAPGGGSDILARLLQPALEKKLGVPVIVDNRPDAAAVMGAAIVTKAKPDGYTLLLTDNSFYQNPAILESLPYDTLNGFTAITMLAQAPVILIVHPEVPAKTLAELIELAKKSNLTFASGGVGSSTHLMGVMVNLKAGTSITHVPFKSSGQALIALLGGHVSMQYGGLASAPPYMKDGKVRAIAITGDKRDAAVPDVPTFKESGLEGVDVSSVWGNLRILRRRHGICSGCGERGISSQKAEVLRTDRPRPRKE